MHPYEPDQSCTLNYKCPDDQHVIVDVLQFDVGDSPQYPPHNYCFDGHVTFNLHDKCGTYGDNPDDSYFDITTQDHQMSLYFYSPMYTSYNIGNGFTIKLDCSGVIFL